MTSHARPQLSLCLIVKDEEDVLARCLASVADIADELVVLDTGSTDGTVALAESLGATVIQGDWHDDFARARNEALTHCHGDWILHLDADEVLEADATALRRQLGDKKIDALQVEILNVGTRVGDYRHHNLRIFRREAGHWVGRLHERVESTGPRRLRTAILSGGLIVHHGYAVEVVEARGKAARNLRIAHAELTQAGPDADVGALLVNVGRAYIGAGDVEFALDHFRRARDAETSAARTIAIQLGTQILVDLGRLDDAREWVELLADVSSDDDLMLVYLRGSIDLFGGRPAPDLEALAHLPAIVNAEGTHITPAELRRRVAAALLAGGRTAEAIEHLLALVVDDPGEEVWGALARATHQAGQGFERIVSHLEPAMLRSVLAQVLTQSVEVAEGVGAAVAERFGDDPRVIAFAVHHCRRVDDLEALVRWSTVIRNGGLDEACPVVDRAADPTVPASDRFTAAVVAHAAFRDQRALELLDSVTPLLAPADEPAAIHVLQELAPDLLVAN